MKGLAIMAVILLHSLSKEALVQIYAVFHIWQAVPVFLVIMGLNLGLSTAKKEQVLGQLYSKIYFRKKAARILLPFVIMFFFSLFAGLVWPYLFQENKLAFNQYTWVGRLPIPGPGNYFITLLLQSVLVLPVVGYGFQKRPFLTGVILVIAEVIFLLMSEHTALFKEHSYLYDSAILRYFTAIAFGLWLSRFINHPSALQVLLLFLGALGSALYLYALVYHKFDFPFFPEAWQTQNLLAFAYAALLVYLGIKVMPASSTNFGWQWLARLGRASYHIFLVQVLYFGLDFSNTPLIADLLICLFMGYLFYKYEAVFAAFIPQFASSSKSDSISK